MLALLSLPVAAARTATTSASRVKYHLTTPWGRKIDVLLLCHCQMQRKTRRHTERFARDARVVVKTTRCARQVCRILWSMRVDAVLSWTVTSWTMHLLLLRTYNWRVDTGVILARRANSALAVLSTWWINKCFTYVKALSARRANGASFGAMHGWIIVVACC